MNRHGSPDVYVYNNNYNTAGGGSGGGCFSWLILACLAIIFKEWIIAIIVGVVVAVIVQAFINSHHKHKLAMAEAQARSYEDNSRYLRTQDVAWLDQQGYDPTTRQMYSDNYDDGLDQWR